MALQYDEPITGGDLNEALEESNLSDSTIDAINQVLGITDPTTPVNVANATFDPATGELTVEQPSGDPQVLIIDLSQATEDQVINLSAALAQANVFIINADVGVTMTFNTVERVITSGNGNDFITVNGDRNTTIDGSDGNDTLVTSGGDDSIISSAGNDSVSTGAGTDTIESGSGNDTIDAGTGYDLLWVGGAKANYTVSVQDGALVIAGANGATVTNAEYIAFGGGGSLTVSGDEGVAATMRLYEALLDRPAEFGGAQFWSEAVLEGGTWTNTVQIADFFLHSDEFQSKYGNPDDLSNEQFVNLLYENVLGRSAEGDGLDFWVDILDSGDYSRSEITVLIAGSPEAATYTDGTVKFIDGWV